MSDYLPLEIVEQILLRVPMKPLGVISTTCKTWYNLITSPRFLLAHFNFTKSLNNNSTRFLFHYNTFLDGRKYVLYADDVPHAIFRRYYRLVLPVDDSKPSRFLRVVGCSNGLICLCDNRVIACAVGKNNSVLDREVVIWNPLIRKCLTLPKSIMHLRFHDDGEANPYSKLCISHDTFGFVFDNIRNDYKVLRIYKWLISVPTKVKKAMLRRPDFKWDDEYKIPKTYDNEDFKCRVDIFRLSSGSWENIRRNVYFKNISSRSLQADLKGIAHWIGEDYNDKVKIITFDGYQEVFGSIELPVNVVLYDDIFEQKSEKYLFTFEESLFLIRCVINPGDEDDGILYDIWKMEEYSVVESWNQVRTCVFDKFVAPLGFKKNGEIIWGEDRGGRLIYTNPEDGSENYFGSCENASSISSCSSYVESLILLDKSVPSGVDE